jgi:DNA-directed RNA polymerase subunit H
MATKTAKPKQSKELVHELVPKHEKLSKKEADELLEEYNISLKQLPQISKTDAAVKHLELSAGDIIRIERRSPTAGVAIFYRVVVDE